MQGSAFLLQLHELAEELGEVDSLPALASVVVAAGRRLIDTNGVCFVPFEPGVPFGANGAFSHDHFEEEFMREQTITMFPITLRDTGGLEQLLAGRGERAMDLNAVLEGRGLERTEVYNEYWRPYKLERQLLAPFGGGASFGTLAVSRPHRGKPFSASDVERLDGLRRMVRPCLKRLLLRGQESAPDVLGALSAGLPLPCAMLDARGELLWSSEAARSLLGLERHARNGPSDAPGLAEWRAVALQAIAKRPYTGEVEGLYARRVQAAPGVPAALVFYDRARLCPESRVAQEARRHALTKREAEVLAILAEGRSNKEIAQVLGCTPRTVEVHVTSVLGKTGCGSRGELLARLFLQS